MQRSMASQEVEIGRGEAGMGLDRRIVWIAAIIILLIALWLSLDHVLFPTLPVPAGAPSIAK